MPRFTLILICSILVVGCTPTPEVVKSTNTLEPTISPSSTSKPLPSSTATTTPAPSPEVTCDSDSGHIEDRAYAGKLVEGEVRMRVYVPPCYESEIEHYPVLYVLHGYPMDELHWGELGIVEVFERGMIDNQWSPMLVVMPHIPDPLNTGSDGGPGSYEEEMLSGLVPFVEGNYRTVGEKSYHAIAGVSRGGVWALEIGFRNPDLFNIVAALSPALHVNRPRPTYDPFNLVALQSELPEHIFLSAAEDEGGFRSKTEELSQLMDSLGIHHSYLLTPGVHEDTTWKAIMWDFLSFISSAWGK